MIPNYLVSLTAHGLGPTLRLQRRRWNALRRAARLALHSIAWPSFECEDCIGMAQHGCFCEGMGAPRAGGPGPEWWRRILRRWVR